MNVRRTLCEHDMRKDKCKKCSKNTFCEHERTKVTCKECKGRYICIHMRRIFECKTCSPHLFCIHGKKFIYCKLCDGSKLCPHARRRHECPQCRNMPVDKTRKWPNVELPPTVIPKAKTVIKNININYWDVIPPSLHKATRRHKTTQPFNTPPPATEGRCTENKSNTDRTQNSEVHPVRFFQPSATDQDDEMFFGDSLLDFTATQSTLDEEHIFGNPSDWPMFPTMDSRLEIDDI